MRYKTIATALAGLALTVTLAACDSSSSTTDNTAAVASSEATQASQGIDFILKNQPVPIFTSSAYRMEVIELEAMQALGSPTTSFFFPGAGMNGNPVKICPSEGLPVPASAQLSNPSQVVPDPYGGGYNLNKGGQVIPQMDPNGVYTGDTTGTYVLCDKANGSTRLAYWEGFVFAESGAAEWSKADSQIVDIGPDQLPVCTVEKAIRGDRSGIKPGTHYYHCIKASQVGTKALITGGHRLGLSVTGFVRDRSGRYGWKVRDTAGRQFTAPVMQIRSK